MVRILLSTRLGERRWTQTELADKTGIRKATINDYYNEWSERISLTHLELMCEALDCDISDLLVIEKHENLLDDPKIAEKRRRRKEQHRR